MAIVTRPATAEYRDNFDATFGKKPEPPDICGLTYCSDGNASGHNGAEFSKCGRPRNHEGPRGDVPGSKCGRGPT